jgi:hypothetical protein
MNNDGRPDLAVATGWPYNPPHSYYNYVYVNAGGQLGISPGWQSADQNHYMGVVWADADDDGWQDLVYVARSSQTQVYRNLGGTLETTASWATTDSALQFAIMTTVGDVNGDGLRDLFTTDNTQLFDGSGRIKQYDGLGGGFFSTTYGWSYYVGTQGYGSAVALADVNADGALDLATGAWWDAPRLFYNTGSGFGAASDWNSIVAQVIEKIVFGDVDRSGRRRDLATFTPGVGQGLFYLGRQPVEEILAVRADGVELGPDEYTAGREHGWVSVASAPAASLEVDYLFSHSLDMAVTDWDGAVGNTLYYNQLLVNGNCDGDTDVDLADYECFFNCMDGPGVVVDVNTCGPFDSDLDRDVDLTDFPAFLALYGE